MVRMRWREVWGPKRTTEFTRWCGGSRRGKTADDVEERAGVDTEPQRPVEGGRIHMHQDGRPRDELLYFCL